MIRIAITPEAFDAVAATLPRGVGSVNFEGDVGADGERLVWLEDAVADRLAA